MKDFDLVIDPNDPTVIKHGIKNFGNTCYLSTVFQCLLGTTHLRKYMLSAQNMRNDIDEAIQMPKSQTNNVESII